MAKLEVTVLTNPLPWGCEFLDEFARRIARWGRGRLCSSRQFFNHPKYRGHFAVTRSLVEGLQSIGASFNYNPLFPWQLAETVIVLAGANTLRQAIRFKKQGRIKKLFAGPNIVVYSSDYNSLLAAPEVDAAITPCEWVSDIYVEDNPTLKDRIFSWPAGVDVDYWRPDPAIQCDQILIFEKQNKGPVGPITPYVNYLRTLGWKVQVIQYGSFTHSHYLRELQKSCLMLGFVVCESQGIAWAEAWACNVPTLIFRKNTNVYQGRHYKNSTAPYLNPKNGLFFDDFKDFKSQFEYWQSNRIQFAPREWTLANMSDEVCASKLYKKVTKC